MSADPPTSRPGTAVDAVADAFVDTAAALDPVLATDIGLPGHDDRMPDLSPDGVAARADAARATLRELDRLVASDEVDVVTLDAMRERLGVLVEANDHGDDLAPLNNIASPLQSLRNVFDLMPTATVGDWETIATRLAALPAALDGYRRSLTAARDRGIVPAVRQVEIGIAQAGELAGEESFFDSFVRGARPAGAEPAAALAGALAEGAHGSRAAYARLAETLREQVAPHAGAEDAVGAERYARASRDFLGTTVDLDETYEWGLAELDRIVAEQEDVAAELYGAGVGPREAMERLDADLARRLHGTDALQGWMQSIADRAVAELADTYFDIPEPVRTIECRIAPTQTGGIYYTGPSDDFSRPGRMWWSVPAGVTEFSTWREKTTVFHEGVPGHHLQIGQTVYRRELLNTFRRLYCWVSGHGEGWALYAERLMDSLGHLADAGERMGMLDEQRLRAARVVLDIGVHLRKPMPGRWGSGTWDAEHAWTFLRANSQMAEDFLRFELDRYLGWPGQAPSYKVGQRVWEQIRDETRAREGAGFDLRVFHRRALDVGSVGLGTLRRALAQP